MARMLFGRSDRSVGPSNSLSSSSLGANELELRPERTGRSYGIARRLETYETTPLFSCRRRNLIVRSLLVALRDG